MKQYIKEMLIEHYRHIHMNNYIGLCHNQLKMRKTNFPECISEYIILLAMQKHLPIKYPNKYSGEIVMKAKTGDLYSPVDGIIECKCVASDGPISFGPNEKWNYLYVLDSRNGYNDDFILYKINMTNEEFSSVKMNHHETFGDQCKLKRRPRINFDTLQQQIYEKIEILVSGSLDHLI